jgi:hypothetical protein
MKKNTFYLFTLLTLISGTVFSQKTIEITNQYPFDRVNEIVEIKATDFGGLKAANFILKDENSQEVPYQLIYSGKTTPLSIVFPVTVKTGTKVVYTISDGEPKTVEAKTFARFVPERKDDFAWENDLAAYRMYGPALVAENPSNGVDLWLKKTEELVVDSFYRGEIKYGKSYHVDHGQGLDLYKVGKTLGAGGVAPYTDSTLWVGSHFNAYKVLENGPLRSVFTLTYDTVNIKGKKYKQELKITVDAGSVLNKAVVKYTGEKQTMQLAAGITLHDGKGKLQKGTGMIIYGEEAVSNNNLPSGQNFVSVVLSVKETAYKVQDLHALLISNYVPGTEFTYYFGGGWSEWKFPTQKEWLAAVQQFSKQVKYPLNVKVVQAAVAK